MEGFNKLFLGDKYLWAFIGVLALFSFLPVYSASSNLEYIVGNGSTTSHIIKHVFFLIIGIFIISMVQLIDYKYFGGFAVLLLPVVIALLILTLLQGGNQDEGGVAKRRLERVHGDSYRRERPPFRYGSALWATRLRRPRDRQNEVDFHETYRGAWLCLACSGE